MKLYGGNENLWLFFDVLLTKEGIGLGNAITKGSH